MARAPPNGERLRTGQRKAVHHEEHEEHEDGIEIGRFPFSHFRPKRNSCRGRRVLPDRPRLSPAPTARLAPADGPRAGALSTWAMLIQRVYEVDPLACPHCGAAMKIVSFIECRQRDVIERILRQCGLWEGPFRTLQKTAKKRASRVAILADDVQSSFQLISVLCKSCPNDTGFPLSSEAVVGRQAGQDRRARQNRHGSLAGDLTVSEISSCRSYKSCPSNPYYLTGSTGSTKWGQVTVSEISSCRSCKSWPGNP